MSRPVMNEDDDEVDEKGLDGFRYENGELLRARDDDAMGGSELELTSRRLRGRRKCETNGNAKATKKKKKKKLKENVSESSHGLRQKSEKHRVFPLFFSLTI
ncbi:hypothetical protein TIFTF001_024987 [Ficus carica]|uniref:Uncharacterized protein n=1 Tax=Ficus carica TaxID=3494 RepID=A0AA88B120_FICCA|nr:hypothetical protein TIFTF001_024987 [Ficus carica]